MDPYKTNSKAHWIAKVAIVLSILAVILCIYSLSRSGSTPNSALSTGTAPILKVIAETGILHAGYGVYPPYTIEDPNTKAVSGFSVDLVERIAKDLKVTVKWHRVNWNTFIPDIKKGDFDLIADPILMTIPRCREFTFSDPYDYFADGVIVVRKDETRFVNFDDLNQAGIKVAVGKGFASETVARGRLPKAEIVPVQMGTDMQQLFNEVAFARVDATLSEGPSAERYVKEHPDTVKSINLTNPAAWIPGAFALRPDDADGARAFSICLSFLRSTGEIEALRRKWGLPVNAPSHSDINK